MKILSLALVLSLALPADRVAFAPEEGSEVTKTFTFTANLDVTEQGMRMGDEEIDIGEEGPAYNLVQRVVVADTYVEAADGRPGKLHRSFQTLTSQAAMSADGMDSEDGVLTSALEGEGVEFEWDADEEAYEVDWDESSEADDELLEGLVEDMDYRALLPAGEVTDGDEWDIDPEAFRAALLPGGDLALGRLERFEMPETEGGIMIRMPEAPQDLSVWLQEIDGEVTATYRGIVEEDDLRLAVIEIELGVNCTSDMTDWFSTFGGMDYDSADSLLALDGEATLRWDLATGRFHDFTLEADADITFEATTSFETPGGPMELEFRQTLEGTVELSGRVGEE